MCHRRGCHRIERGSGTSALLTVSSVTTEKPPCFTAVRSCDTNAFASILGSCSQLNPTINAIIAASRNGRADLFIGNAHQQRNLPIELGGGSMIRKLSYTCPYATGNMNILFLPVCYSFYYPIFRHLPDCRGVRQSEFPSHNTLEHSRIRGDRGSTPPQESPSSDTRGRPPTRAQSAPSCEFTGERCIGHVGNISASNPTERATRRHRARLCSATPKGV